MTSIPTALALVTAVIVGVDIVATLPATYRLQDYMCPERAVRYCVWCTGLGLHLETLVGCMVIAFLTHLTNQPVLIVVLTAISVTGFIFFVLGGFALMLSALDPNDVRFGAR
ncbi:MAG: hypothetical protein WDZ82_02145 [Candidatus Paceibacterota bacterium]